MFSYSVKSLAAKTKKRGRNFSSRPTLVFDFLLDKKHGRLFGFSSAALWVIWYHWCTDAMIAIV